MSTMTDKLVFSPHKLPTFKGGEAKYFCLLVSHHLDGKIVVEPDSDYAECYLRVLPENSDIDSFIRQNIQNDTDIVYIPYGLASIFPRRGTLQSRQRLLILFVNKQSAVDFSDLESIFDNVYETSLVQLKESARKFFSTADHTRELIIFDPRYHTEAIVKLDNQCLWTENIGTLGLREMTFAPYGELTLTHKKLLAKKIHPLSINGNIILNGEVMLLSHATDETALAQRQEIYQGLRSINTYPINLKVVNGDVTQVSAMNHEGKEIANRLEAFFSIHERLSRIIEVGIGINTSLKLRPGNLATNECYGSTDNCVHFGFGKDDDELRYHADFLCPNAKVTNEDGDYLVGRPD